MVEVRFARMKFWSVRTIRSREISVARARGAVGLGGWGGLVRTEELGPAGSAAPLRLGPPILGRPQLLPRRQQRVTLPLLAGGGARVVDPDGVESVHELRVVLVVQHGRHVPLVDGN